MALNALGEDGGQEAVVIVVEAAPEKLGAACVQAYLRAKARARL